MMVMSTSASALQQMNAQLDAGASGFTGTELGTRIVSAYGRGAGFLLAADLQTIAQENHPGASAQHEAVAEASGLHDMRYLVMEHREINNLPDNRAVLQFAGERTGVASWLAAPAPMGALEYVSHNAGLALAFVAKEPAVHRATIFCGSRQNATGSDSSSNKLHVNLRDDVAAPSRRRSRSSRSTAPCCRRPRGSW